MHSIFFEIMFFRVVVPGEDGIMYRLPTANTCTYFSPLDLMTTK